MATRIILLLVIIASSFVLGMCVEGLRNIATIEKFEKRLEPKDKPPLIIHDAADLTRYNVDTTVPGEVFRSDVDVSEYVASSIAKQLEPLILKTVISERDILTDKVRYRFELWVK